MPKRKKTNEPSLLDKAIDEAYSDLAGFTADSDEYAKISEQIRKLTELRHQTRTGIRGNADLWLPVAAPILGNLAGISMIIGYERAHIITSKSLLFIKSLGR